MFAGITLNSCGTKPNEVMVERDEDSEHPFTIVMNMGSATVRVYMSEKEIVDLLSEVKNVIKTMTASEAARYG